MHMRHSRGLCFAGTFVSQKMFGDGSSYARAFFYGQLATATCTIFSIILVLRFVSEPYLFTLLTPSGTTRAMNALCVLCAWWK